MTDVLLIVFVIAAVVIAGFALEKHSKKAKEELADELADEELTTECPAPAPEVKQLVESQEEQSVPKPAKKRRRGRPAAKKD
jgi:hypothetical protein